MAEPVRLAVDLGTTHTVAVVRRGGQEPRALLFDGTPLLSSGVFVDAGGNLHTGRDAQRLGAAEPHRFEPHPKRRVDEGSVLLGDHDLAVEHLLAATLRRVADEARVAGVSPVNATVLTCPADWGQPRRAVLLAAAWRAGLGEVRLLDEPIAAATYCVQVLGQQVPPGGALGVFDFGGGTFDVTVVRREAGGMRVLATGGLDDLGGLDVDSALVEHLGQLVAVRDPDLWARLDRAEGVEARRDRQAFWAEVRAAKEMLSRSSAAPVHVPGRAEPMHLTRDELERVAGPLVARAVDETRRVLERAGVAPEALAGLLLVGGASRMPLVAARLHARLGVAPAVPEQPELPVAYGALVHAAAAVAPPPAGPPSSYPVSGPFGAPGTSGSPYPVSSPFAGGAVSGPPSPAFAGAAPPGAPGPVSPPFAGGAAQGPPFAAGAPPFGARPSVPVVRKRRPVRRAVVALVAFVVVGGLVAGVVQGARWLGRTFDGAGNNGITFGSGTDNGGGTGSGNVGGDGGNLATTHTVELTGEGAAGVTVAGDKVVYALASAENTKVVALPGGGGDAVWERDVAVEPEGIRLTAVGNLIVLDGDRSATDNGDNVRAVLNAADGKPLWKKVWENRTDVAYLGTDAVVEVKDGFENSMERVDLRSGKVRWTRCCNDDLMSMDDHRIEPVLRWPDGKTDGGRAAAVKGVLADSFVAATDRIVELDADDGKGAVVDAATGKVKSSGNLPLEDDTWTVFGDKVIGIQSDIAAKGAVVLAAYQLPNFKQVWTLRQKAGADITRVKPCGDGLVCAAMDEKTIAVDVDTGKEAWSVAQEWSDDAGWYATPSGLIFGDATFDTVNEARILSSKGEETAKMQQFTLVEAVSGTRMAVRGNRISGSTVILQISVVDLASKKQTKAVDVGTTDGAPDQVSLAGDLVAVLTGDRRVLALKVADLG